MRCIYNLFTGTYKRIPLHYSLWEKPFIGFFFLWRGILRCFKHNEINMHHWNKLPHAFTGIVELEAFTFTGMYKNISLHCDQWENRLRSIFNEVIILQKSRHH